MTLAIVVILVGLIFICSIPLAANESVFAAAADRPVLVLPVNLSVGLAAEPAGNVSAPVIVSPVFKRLRDALPVSVPVRLPVIVAVIVPAAKLPETSRVT